jgi:hypothetical protein
MGGKGIEISPKPIGFNGYVASCAALSPFENRMFDEMANSVEFRSFVAGATSHPNSRGH